MNFVAQPILTGGKPRSPRMSWYILQVSELLKNVLLAYFIPQNPQLTLKNSITANLCLPTFTNVQKPVISVQLNTGNVHNYIKLIIK